jgi:hypothetical protein
MQRFTIRKKVKGPKNKKLLGGDWVSLVFSILQWCVFVEAHLGGGEVSGGGTHYM